MVFCKRAGAVPDKQALFFRFRNVCRQPQSFVVRVIIEFTEELCGNCIGSVRRYAKPDERRLAWTQCGDLLPQLLERSPALRGIVVAGLLLGYASLINFYITKSHAPAVWKAVMGLAASHAAMAAPMQGLTEISLGILLFIGLFTRPAALVAFLFLGSLWISEWGTSWIWELLVPELASLGLAIGSAGRRWGVDAWLSQRWPSAPWWLI